MANNPLDRVRRALAKYDDAVARAEQSRLALVHELRSYDMATGCRGTQIDGARQLLDWHEKTGAAA